MAEELLKEKIEELEKELSTTKVNKRTEAAVGLLKAKIARLKEELEVKLSSGGGKGEGYAVKKEGDATVGLLGKPSVGKSTLLSKVTNKESKIGAYEFTTLEVVPGLLHHKHTNLQILDLPGIIDRASDNRGFGKKVLSVVRACDLIVFVIDSRFPEEMDMLMKEVQNAGIRVNEQRPHIEVKRLSKGGVVVPLNKSKETLPYELIKEVVNDNKMTNAEVIIHEEGCDVEDLIDALYDNRVYTRGVACFNKIDLFSPEEMKEKINWFKKNYPSFDLFGVSAEEEVNLEGFKDFIWEELGFIWVYLKEQKKEPDMEKPLVVKRGNDVKRVCEKIHKDLLLKFKYAKVKGESVKFEWQRVGLEHKVEDGDIVEIFAR